MPSLNRIAMNRSSRRWIQELKPERLSVCEISGKWGEQFGFKILTLQHVLDAIVQAPSVRRAPPRRRGPTPTSTAAPARTPGEVRERSARALRLDASHSSRERLSIYGATRGQRAGALPGRQRPPHVLPDYPVLDDPRRFQLHVVARVTIPSFLSFCILLELSIGRACLSLSWRGGTARLVALGIVLSCCAQEQPGEVPSPCRLVGLLQGRLTL